MNSTGLRNVESLTFEHSHAGVLKIDSAALAALRSFQQHADDATEAGGILLGRYIRQGHDVIVDEVTTPQPGDVRARMSFDRLGDHQRLIEKAWVESAGTCQFLGSWHTHPEPAPTPSAIDIDDWHRSMRQDVHEGDCAFFFVIVGTEEIRCWEGDRRAGTVTRLGVSVNSSGSRDRKAEGENR